MDELQSYSAIPEDIVEKLLTAELEKNKKKLIVLDDDPTGVQTVHDVSVYTDWDVASIRQGFEEEQCVFYILTNSRGLTSEQTKVVHRQIADRVELVSKECKKEYMFISRSDSTLRGHYPLETEVLRECYEKNTNQHIDGEILCPFFKEGGRFTIDDVHYAKYGEELIPVNETEFAKDKTFGYRASALPEYVEEKTQGKYRKEDVMCISLQDIHTMNIEKIEMQLEQVENFCKVVVNAINEIDVKVFCIALYRVMTKGKRFLIRGAASIVKVMSGVSDQPFLKRSQMIKKHKGNGGIIIVGSHTQKTNRQMGKLKEFQKIAFIELDVGLINEKEALEKELARCLLEEERYIKEGKTVCCYTKREQVVAGTGSKEDELKLSVQISQAVQLLIGKLKSEPAFIIAKGGITSSDVGTKALNVKRATVLGQICPGIPVWQTGEESRFPQIPYIIFPGNVGDDSTLKEVVRECLGEEVM